MKNRFYKLIGIAMAIASPIAVYAAYTGPTAAPTGNNTAGPVWLSPSSQQTGSINVSGMATIGDNINITNGKALSIPVNSGVSSLYISNYGSSPTGFTANIVGDLTISAGSFGFNSTSGTLRVPTICLNGTCRNSWPSGSGGTIGGSGTTNYIPLFSAGTAIGNSIMTQNSTGIGVGTASAAHKLHIVSATGEDGVIIDAPTFPEVQFNRSGVGKAYIGVSGAAGGYAGGTLADSLVVRSENALHLVSNAGTIGETITGGNVGIGTTAPGYKLDVNGVTNITGGIQAQRFGSVGIVSNLNNTFKTYDIMSATDAPTSDSWHRVLTMPSADSNYPSALVGTMTNNQARLFYQSKEAGFTSGWKEVIMANSAGNVGIGTQSPAYKLDVAGDIIANNWLRTRGSTGWYNETYGGGWYMSDGAWLRTYNSKNTWTGSGLMGSDGGLTVGYGGATPPSPTGQAGAIIAGTVGIGTSNPTNARLEVQTTGGNGIYAYTQGGSGVRGVSAAGWGVYGIAQNSGDGVHGVNQSSGGNGVYGEATAGTANANGVRGDTNGPSGSGVYGYNSTAGSGQGVFGVGYTGILGSGSLYGVYGSGQYGVYGSGLAQGIYGTGPYGVIGNGSLQGVIGQGGSIGGNFSGSSYGAIASGGSYSFYGSSGEMYNSGLIRSAANGAPYFCGGDDACLYDVNQANMVGIYGTQDSTRGALRLGSSGGTMYGYAGRIGIGISNPATTLSLYSGSEVYTQTWLQNNDANCGYAATAWTDGNFYLNRWCGGASASAYMTPAGAWIQYSDRDLKKDIETLKYGIDDVMKLKPVQYVRKDDTDNKPLIGFIAQDVQKVIPELVSGTAISDGGTGLGLNYQNMTAVLTSAIQDQQKEIEDLKDQNADLLKRLEALEAKVK